MAGHTDKEWEGVERYGKHGQPEAFEKKGQPNLFMFWSQQS